MKNLFPLFVFVCIFQISTQSQIVQELLSSSSYNYSSESDYIVSWSIGECITETFGTDNIITQGFHQSNYQVTYAEILDKYNIDVKVFPNPTTDKITLQIKNNDEMLNMHFILYDLSGKLLLKRQLEDNQEDIFLKSYQTKNFILTLSTENDKITTIKVQKIN